LLLEHGGQGPLGERHGREVVDGHDALVHLMKAPQRIEQV
jgi:hypothetical protein